MTNTAECPVCNSQEAKRKQESDGVIIYDCPICGRYEITGTAKVTGPFPSPVVSAWIREQNLLSADLPAINSNNIETIIDNNKNKSVLEKQIALLRAIEIHTKFPGQGVKIDLNKDYPLSWASNSDELRYHFNCLNERGLINILGKAIGALGEAIISPEGWNYLEQIKFHPSVSTQAFIAMSFSSDMDNVWEQAIEPAVKRSGYNPYRVDKTPHSDRIDAKIIAEINRSRFMVADVTEQRQGVYFEAGYAIGMDIPVLWSVMKSELDKVHFDTRQYNHIVWNKPEELEKELYYRISALIGVRNIDTS